MDRLSLPGYGVREVLPRGAFLAASRDPQLLNRERPERLTSVIDYLGQRRWTLAIALLGTVFKRGLEYAESCESSRWELGASLARNFASGLSWEPAVRLAAGRCWRLGRHVEIWRAAAGTCALAREWSQALSGLSSLRCRGGEICGAAIGGAFASLHQGGSPWRSSLSFLRVVRRARLALGAKEFSKVLRSCARHDWKSSLYFLHLARTEASEIKDSVTAAAISAFCRDFRPWQWACSLLKDLQHWQVPLEQKTRNSVLGVFARRPLLWREVLRLELEMESSELVPDEVARTAFRVARARRRRAERASERRNGAWPEALHLLQDLGCNAQQPDLGQMHAAANACQRKSRWEMALQLSPQLSRIVKGLL
ncbi:unnamed protein product [Effrenium voratum]|uniref:Uncharacterized protein n=1 Tax=Effrenium voratum TaxID=2562239 RepID=A0AA36IWK1_9DINO|nr:unnamed protein product [Effrenium voratum]